VKMRWQSGSVITGTPQGGVWVRTDARKILLGNLTRDLLIAGTEEYVIRHRRQAEAILASDASAADKLLRYVLDRFRASLATRGRGHRPAAELLRVRPERRLEEGRMMAEYFVRILRLGMETGELYTDYPERDACVFLLSLAFLFPSALDKRAHTPTEEDALVVVDWFLHVWRQSSARPARTKRNRR
jgi:hypothetical protein